MSASFSQVLDQAQKNVATATNQQKEINILAAHLSRVKADILSGYKKASNVNGSAGLAYLNEIKFFLEDISNGTLDISKFQAEEKEINLLKNTIKVRLGFGSIHRPKKTTIKNKLLSELKVLPLGSIELEKASLLLVKMFESGMHEEIFWAIAKEILEIVDSVKV
jgi:hypothetical protein